MRRRPLAYSSMGGPTAITETPGTAGSSPALPLAQRQVGHLVPGLRRAAPRGCDTSARRRRRCEGKDSRRRRRSALRPQHPRRHLHWVARSAAHRSWSPRVVTPDRSVSTLEQTSAVAAETVVPLVSVVIPCLNEEENVERCVLAAIAALRSADLAGEVIVVDNDSEDRSAEIAAAAGARVISERRRGYGSAYLAGFAAARGTYIVMADADLTYDFNEIPNFVARAGVRRAARDGQPHGQHPAGRDAVAAPLHRQPAPDRRAQPVLPHRRARRPLRHARAAHRRAADARPAHDRDGVRLGDGDPRRQGEPRRSPRSTSSTTRAAASPSCRASATAGATCASCSSTARPTCSSCPARCSRRSAR